MYEKITNYINAIKSKITIKRFIIVCGCVLLLIGACQLIDGYFTARANYNRAIDKLEQGKKSNESSIELNRRIQSEIDRSTILNHEAERRIEQIEVYQREASERIDESKARLDEARRLLESNQQIFRDCEQGNPAIKENGDSTP